MIVLGEYFTPQDERISRMKLSEQQLLVMQHILKAGQVKSGDVARDLALPKRTLQRALQELTRKRLLVKHGTGKSTWYEAIK